MNDSELLDWLDAHDIGTIELRPDASSETAHSILFGGLMGHLGHGSGLPIRQAIQEYLESTGRLKSWKGKQND